MTDIPPKRRRRRNSMDRIFAREQGMLALETRRIAVLAHVAEELSELNAMLREAGLGTNPIFSGQLGQYTPPQPYQQPQGQSQPAPARPCAWCGRPGLSTNVGNGVVQDLCQIHRGLIGGQQRVDAAVEQKTGFAMNHTDARPTLTVAPPQGKVIMQPTAADVRAAEQHATEANGVPQVQTPAGFEELEE